MLAKYKYKWKYKYYIYDKRYLSLYTKKNEYHIYTKINSG